MRASCFSRWGTGDTLQTKPLQSCSACCWSVFTRHHQTVILMTFSIKNQNYYWKILRSILASNKPTWQTVTRLCFTWGWWRSSRQEQFAIPIGYQTNICMLFEWANLRAGLEMCKLFNTQFKTTTYINSGLWFHTARFIFSQRDLNSLTGKK